MPMPDKTPNANDKLEPYYNLPGADRAFIDTLATIAQQTDASIPEVLPTELPEKFCLNHPGRTTTYHTHICWQSKRTLKVKTRNRDELSNTTEISPIDDVTVEYHDLSYCQACADTAQALEQDTKAITDGGEQ